MCLYNSISVRAINLAERYKCPVVAFDDERYVVPASSRNPYPIVLPKKEIALFEWGLIPRWKKPTSNARTEEIEKISQEAYMLQKETYNARAETIFENPYFKDSILKRRCIIPSTGYIEYHHFTTKLKQPYFIFLKNEKVFSMAGIFDYWVDPTTLISHQTFSLITTSTEGNELTGWIHNGGRNANSMPVILKPEDEEKWLEDSLTEEEIKKFFKTYNEGEMDAFPIAKEFRDPMYSHLPTVLKPIEQEIC